MLLVGEDSEKEERDWSSVSGMTYKQRAWRVMCVHKPDPMEAAIAAEIEDAVKCYKETTVAPLRAELDREQGKTVELAKTAGDAIGTLKAVLARLQQLVKTSEKVDMVYAKLFEITRAYDKNNNTNFASASRTSDSTFFQVTTREMETWLDDVGFLLKLLEELKPQPAPAAGGDRACETCGRFGVGPCEGCSQENPKQWTPQQIGKGG